MEWLVTDPKFHLWYSEKRARSLDIDQLFESGRSRIRGIPIQDRHSLQKIATSHQDRLVSAILIEEASEGHFAARELRGDTSASEQNHPFQI